MPELVPIAHSNWIPRRAGKRLRKMYGPKTRLCFNSIPLLKVWPEWFCKSYMHDVEFMLVLLQEGAWLDGRDWQQYVRYTISKRMRVRLNTIFREPFLDIRDMTLDYQLNGGTYKTRDQIKRYAGRVWAHPESTEYTRATARLLLSLTDDIMSNALIQPFHWIRTIVGLSDPNPVFSMALVQSEMFRQKVTLCQMLRAKSND